LPFDLLLLTRFSLTNDIFRLDPEPLRHQLQRVQGERVKPEARLAGFLNLSLGLKVGVQGKGESPHWFPPPEGS
jgi:hypothetical protein